jgi:hypothetical protein
VNHLRSVIGLTETQARLVLQIAENLDSSDVAFVQIGKIPAAENYNAGLSMSSTGATSGKHICYLDMNNLVCIVTYDHNNQRGVVSEFDSHIA